MSKLDRLVRRYEQFVSLPWESGLSGAQRVWFVVYGKSDERRLRARIPEFELATKSAGHGWIPVDISDSFAEWLAKRDYCERYFKEPELLALSLPSYHAFVVKRLQEALGRAEADEITVVAISGIGSVYGFTRVSALVQDVVADIRGRLLVFFPGDVEDNNYRLLDARDGWNYLAVPIMVKDEATLE